MELSPELLTNVTFGEQFRGYREDEVDEFLERVAAAVAELLGHLREAERRAGDAERALAEQAASDEIRRTLLLAQRTASTAVEEARAEAQRIVADAESGAADQVAAAESRLARIEVEIDQREREQLSALAERRAALESDIAALTEFARDHRERLRVALEVQLQAVSDSAFELPQPPTTSDVVVGAGPSAEDWAADPDVAGARAELLAALSRVADDASVDPAPIDETPIEEAPIEEAPIEEAPIEEASSTGAGVVMIDAEPASFEAAASEARHDGVDDTGDVPASALFDEPSVELAAPVHAPVDDLPEVVDPPAATPLADDPVEWRHAVIGDEPDDDPFLAELRRAVTDTEPLGPRPDPDDSDIHAFDLEAGGGDMAPPGRFRLRRSRR